MPLGCLNECGMMEILKRNLMKMFVVARYIYASIVCMRNNAVFILRQGKTEQWES